MARKKYIEVEDLLDRVCAMRNNLQLELNNPFEDGIRMGIEDVEIEIENIPSADVRPVVLCKDCKYWGLSEIELSFHVCKYLYGAEVVRNEDDFCSRAKKMEES